MYSIISGSTKGQHLVKTLNAVLPIKSLIKDKVPNVWRGTNVFKANERCEVPASVWDNLYAFSPLNIGFTEENGHLKIYFLWRVAGGYFSVASMFASVNESINPENAIVWYRMPTIGLKFNQKSNNTWGSWIGVWKDLKHIFDSFEKDTVDFEVVSTTQDNSKDVTLKIQTCTALGYKAHSFPVSADFELRRETIEIETALTHIVMSALSSFDKAPLWYISSRLGLNATTLGRYKFSEPVIKLLERNMKKKEFALQFSQNVPSNGYLGGIANDTNAILVKETYKQDAFDFTGDFIMCVPCEPSTTIVDIAYTPLFTIEVYSGELARATKLANTLSDKLTLTLAHTEPAQAPSDDGQVLVNLTVSASKSPATWGDVEGKVQWTLNAATHHSTSPIRLTASVTDMFSLINETKADVLILEVARREDDPNHLYLICKNAIVPYAHLRAVPVDVLPYIAIPI